jgi:hypothetical protein
MDRSDYCAARYRLQHCRRRQVCLPPAWAQYPTRAADEWTREPDSSARIGAYRWDPERMPDQGSLRGVEWCVATEVCYAIDMADVLER